MSKSLPEDYDQILELYTKEGFRVIALAEKVLPGLNIDSVMGVSRDSVECELNFLGLLIMENKLKPQTIGVINELQRCNIKTIMATGDNVLTGISVAR